MKVEHSLNFIPRVTLLFSSLLWCGINANRNSTSVKKDIYDSVVEFSLNKTNNFLCWCNINENWNSGGGFVKNELDKKQCKRKFLELLWHFLWYFF